MKRIYRRHVQAALDRQVPAALPGYALLPVRLSHAERAQATLFAGSRLYRRLLPEGWATFIHFIPHQTQEDLLVEVGWSLSGAFPHALSSHGPARDPADERLEEAWLIPFGLLYHRRYGRGFVGWEVWTCSVSPDHPDFQTIFMLEDLAPVSDEQAQARAESAVRACLADVSDVAVPYLEAWVRFRRGLAET